MILILQRLLFVFGLLLASVAGAGDGNTSALRLLSLSPGLTETIYALGLGDQLVGRSDYCDYPAQVLDLPPMGTAMTPNFEAIAGLAPGLILTESNAGSSQFELQRLAELMALPWLTLDDVVAGVRLLGERLDRRRQATQLADRLLARLAVQPPTSGPRVLLLLSGQIDGSPLWYIRRNSLHGAALRAAGGQNAVARDIRGNASISIEGLLALDPDAIIVLLAEDLPIAEARQRVQGEFARLPTLLAVQHRKIGVLTAPGFLRTGPRILDFTDALENELARLGVNPAVDGPASAGRP